MEQPQVSLGERNQLARKASRKPAAGGPDARLWGVGGRRRIPAELSDSLACSWLPLMTTSPDFRDVLPCPLRERADSTHPGTLRALMSLPCGVDVSGSTRDGATVAPSAGSSLRLDRVESDQGLSRVAAKSGSCSYETSGTARLVGRARDLG